MDSVIPWATGATLSLGALFCMAPVGAGASPEPDPDRGLYAIWISQQKSPFDLPFIKGGQVVCQWAELEPEEGRYDFAPLDEKLKEFHLMGRKASVQVNGNLKPAWLFSKVAVLPHAVHSQVRDKQGTLQYWDPIHRDAYRDFVMAYGKHLRQSPYRDSVLGVRLNFNAIGTEQGTLKPEERSLDRWKPAPNGHIHNEPWTPELFDKYRLGVVQTFIEAFRPDIGVFVRNNILRNGLLDPEQIAMFEKGELGLFHTSSEIQPRGAGGEGQYQAFLKYCRTGKTLGYAESWADAWGRHGGKTDPRPFSPYQWNYWRLLVDLHYGISFIAIYGADLRAHDDPEFRAAFEFAARYAGFHASPNQSPGAWVALRQGQFLQGDYNFLMTRLPERSGDVPLDNAGPDDQRFGRWARAIEGPGQMLFRLDPQFAASLRGNPCRIRLVYLDDGTNSLAIHWDEAGKPGARAVQKSGMGRWKELLIDVPEAGFGAGLDGADIQLSGEGRNVFHMVEVLR